MNALNSPIARSFPLLVLAAIGLASALVIACTGGDEDTGETDDAVYGYSSSSGGYGGYGFVE